VLITGDVKFHDAIAALDSNMTIIDAGHIIEIIFNDVMAEIINNFDGIEAIPSDIDVDPFVTI